MATVEAAGINVQQALAALLADYQVLYQKARNYHWNLTGHNFFELHEKFEELYTELAETADVVAERIRTLGGRPPSTLAEFLEHARLEEDKSVPKDTEMVRNLADDYRAINDFVRSLADTADDDEDIGTENMAEDLIERQEKTVWMLESWLG